MKNKSSYISYSVFLVVLLYLTYIYVMKALPNHLSDYNGHTYVYYPLFTREHIWEALSLAPYCMWHAVVFLFNKIMLMPLNNSSAYSACVFAALSFYVFAWTIKRSVKYHSVEISDFTIAFLAFLLCVVQPISLPWADVTAYSPNPLYSPTQMCVRAFTVLCFCLVSDIWGLQENENYVGKYFHVENGSKKYYIMLALALFLSTMAKPTFAEMFIPAVAVMMLIKLLIRVTQKNEPGEYFKKCLYMLYAAIPALVSILIQFFTYFLFKGHGVEADGSFIITRFLEVWEIYSDNVILSMILSLAFPMLMLLMDTRFFIKNSDRLLIIICLVISFFESAFFGESGGKFANCNFFWPLMSAMLLLFFVAVERLVVLSARDYENRYQRLLIAGAWILVIFHGFFGVLELIGA